jgi:hypothetical protein
MIAFAIALRRVQELAGSSTCSIAQSNPPRKPNCKPAPATNTNVMSCAGGGAVQDASVIAGASDGSQFSPGPMQARAQALLKAPQANRLAVFIPQLFRTMALQKSGEVCLYRHPPGFRHLKPTRTHAHDTALTTIML